MQLCAGHRVGLRARHNSLGLRVATQEESPAPRCPKGLGELGLLVCRARALEVVGNPRYVRDTLRYCLLCDPWLFTFPLGAARAVTCNLEDWLHLDPSGPFFSSGFTGLALTCWDITPIPFIIENVQTWQKIIGSSFTLVLGRIGCQMFEVKTPW